MTAFSDSQRRMKQHAAIRPSSRAIAYLCTLIYFSSYVLRLNFAVMLVKICSDLQVEKEAAALVVTCLTVAYGFGQVISGALGDRFNPRHIITAGLALATLCNGLMYFSTAIWNMAVIWSVNGFAHAMLWPPILKIFSGYLSEEEYSFAVVRVSWGSSAASVLLYLLCPAMLHFMTWRQVILSCAAVGVAVLAVWVGLCPRLLRRAVPNRTAAPADGEPTAGSRLPRAIFVPIALIMLGIVLQGILRDGVTNWMPSFLLETFRIPEENAIVCTVILAVFSIISFGLFDWINQRFFKNEVSCAAFTFVLAAAASVLLYIADRFFRSVVLSMLLMALIVSCMHGINLMLIGIVPKRFARVNKVATFSGVLNACTYIGASVSTYVFAVLADTCGWSFLLFTWILISLLGAAVCRGAILAGWTKKFQSHLS